MRTAVAVILFVIMALVSVLPSSAAEYRKTKVAVLDFQQQGRFETEGIGRIAAEWLTTSLVETGRFEIIERRLLNQILDEQKMSSSGLVDPTNATRLGKILGVKTVVTGTIQHYETIFELNVRLINVETGSIITADRVRAGSTASLRNMVNRISERIAHHFPLQGYLVQRKDSSVMIDLGRQSGVVPGLVFTVFVEGAPLRHPKTGEVLSVERIEKGSVKITEVREKTSLGTIIKENGEAFVQAGQQVSSIQMERIMRQEEIARHQEDERKRLEEEQADRKKWEEEAKEAKEERVKQEKKLAEENRRQTGQGRVLTGLATLVVFPAHNETLTALAISPTGGIIAVGDDDGNIVLWNPSSRQQIFTTPAHRGTVTAIDFSSDGKFLASSGKDKQIRIWDINRQHQTASITVADKPTDIEFSRSGQYLAVASDGKESWIWEIKSSRIKTIKNNDDVLAVAFSPDSRTLATAGQDKAISIWNSDSGKLLRQLKGHNGDVRKLAFLDNRRLVSVAEDKRGFVWDIKTGIQLRQLGGHNEEIHHLAISRDGKKLFTGEGKSGDGLVISWNPESGRELQRYRASRNIDQMWIAPDGTALVVGHDKNLSVYKLN